MSMQMIKKFRKNDWSYDDEEFESSKNEVNKREEKRIERALRTRDLTALLEDEDETCFGMNYSTFETFEEDKDETCFGMNYSTFEEENF